MYAGAQRVKRLIAVIDNNRVQLSSKTDAYVNPMPLKEKLEAFRWAVIEADGHDFDSLVPALEQARALSEQGPAAVIADTVKGKGVSFMEGDYRWHGMAPNDEQLAEALREIEKGAAS
jgi:transketolase